MLLKQKKRVLFIQEQIQKLVINILDKQSLMKDIQHVKMSTMLL